MNYEHRSSVRPNKTPFAIKAVGLFIIVLSLIYIFFPKFLPAVSSMLATPFWAVEKNVRDMSSPPVSMELQNALISELQQENFELKYLMQRSVSSTTLLAYILKKPPFSAYDSLVIDVGTDHEVEVGDKVFAAGNILLGEVVEVAGATSKVKLYSSPGEKYEVFIGDEEIQATAEGRGGGSFEVSLPRDVKVTEGDVVTIPSLRVSVFGIVKRVTQDPVRVFSTVFFSQPINIFEQKWVEVDIMNDARDEVMIDISDEVINNNQDETGD